MFVNEQAPAEFCYDKSPMWKVGTYRIYDCTPNLIELGVCREGQRRVRERISYCRPEIKSYLSIKDSDLTEILRKAGIK